MLKLVLLLLISLCCKSALSEELLGCGGFIKTEVDINFSLVEVKLYTKQGSLKYQTECAPNNGYYMLPVYNKGEYVIKVEAPSGWTFDPMSYNIAIDGKTDKCTLSEDINFRFTGFGVVGKVISKGESSGPAGVLLVLKSPSSGEILRKATSQEGGMYTFEKVLPGDYIVEASHPTWVFESAKGSVSLTTETGWVTDTIIVSGFDVKGKIVSEGEPVSGVNFLLYGKKDTKDKLIGCSESKLFHEVPSVDGAKFLCHVVSNEHGHFLFPSVQSGDYILLPFYKGEKIKYDVTPGSVEVSVRHDSVDIKTQFQVAGFAVSGRVKASVGDTGIQGAKIFVNKNFLATTNEDGSFHLEAMKTGVYLLQVQSPRMFFNDLYAKVTPNTPQLPDLVASKFEVCGGIVVGEAFKSSLGQKRSVVLKNVKGEKYVETQSDDKGNFCVFAAPGAYKCSVQMTEEEKEAGFKLLPSENIVEVVHSPVDGVIFSQFSAKVSGTVKCMENCGAIQLSLSSSLKMNEPKIVNVSSEGSLATFQCEDLMVGSYELTILNDGWCWEKKSLRFDIIDKDLVDLVFVHSGYTVACHLSHDAHLIFSPVVEKDQSSSDSSLHFDLRLGLNKGCIKEAGSYMVNVQSCHLFEDQPYKYDTSMAEVLSMSATRHKVEISVTSSNTHDDIVAVISNQQSGDTERVGPLKMKPKTSQDADYEYIYYYWIKAGEKISVSLESGILLFEPSSVQVAVKADLCPSGKASFKGREGAFIEGAVSPSLAGVNVHVSLNSGNVLHTVTDDHGKYRIGPIDSDLTYNTTVSMSGYAFSSVPGQKGFFKASKLAEIIVKVFDESTGDLLPGVLLSLSGGDSFRKNNVTQETGVLAFENMGPGQYFLKPMMKEYEFEPSSKFIKVAEGETVVVDVVAKRVAFSCYGHVTSLNGEAEVGVHLEAVSESGNAECEGHQEESKTGLDGSIRIRGLRPGCNYILRMKDDKDLNTNMERTSPKQIKLQVRNEDITGIRLIAFRKITFMDVTGRVVAQQEHLSFIKVHLLQESNLDSAQHSTNLGPSPFFYFSSIPIDNQSYVLRLTSTLSRSNYNFTLPELRFRADSTFRHFVLNFDAQPKLGDQELAHSSLFVLPLTFFVLYICYNYEQVLPFIVQYVQGIFTYFASRANQHHHQQQQANAQSSSAVDSFNADLLFDTTSKKKQKVKKI